MDSLTDKEMEALVEEADCNAEVCFRNHYGQDRLLGWARRLINIAFQAGIRSGSGDKRFSL